MLKNYKLKINENKQVEMRYYSFYLVVMKKEKHF